MSLLSRRRILKTGLGAVPAIAIGQSVPAFAQSCAVSTPAQGCGAVTPTFLRQVATGCHAPNREYLGVPQVLSRSPHFNRSGLTLQTLRIVVPNCVGGISLPQTRKVWQAQIEYPLNTLTPVTWNCAPEVIGTGAHEDNPGFKLFLISDEITLNVAIPDNALFWVRLSQKDPTGTAGLLCQDIGNLQSSIPRSFNKALGETNCAGDASILTNPVMRDPTLGFWAFTGNGVVYGSSAAQWASVRPLAILGQSRKPAFSLWGDSRVCGIGDTFDGVCDDRGEVERSIGAAYAYINLAIPGQPLADVSGTFAQYPNDRFPGLVPHFGLGQYTTNLIENLGGRDCINDPTDEQFVEKFWTNKTTLWNGWTSLGNSAQSLSTLTFAPAPGEAKAADALLKTIVDALRAGVTWQNDHRLSDQDPLNPQVRVLDVASIVGAVTVVGDTAVSKYDWSCSNYAAEDNLHESQAGCLAIAESGIIDPYALTR